MNTPRKRITAEDVLRMQTIKECQLKVPNKHQVEVIQYLRPDGRTELMLAPLDDERLVLASREMVISAEVLTTGEVAIYARKKDEAPEEEVFQICPNGPQVTITLANVIRSKMTP